LAKAKNIADLGGGDDQPVGQRLDDLYRDHGDWLRQLVGSRLRMQTADADDIVQETYLRLARAPGVPIERPRALLSRIALNLFRDRRRREAVRAEHAAAIHLVPPADPGRGAMSEQEAALAIERLVVEMPEAWRDVFVLSRFRHMSNRDVAAHLGLSIKTVEWRMSRALDYCLRTLRE
jgi:RNA polymerase sigma factor (sigma-70 family)